MPHADKETDLVITEIYLHRKQNCVGWILYDESVVKRMWRQ